MCADCEPKRCSATTLRMSQGCQPKAPLTLMRSWTTSIIALTQVIHEHQAVYLQPPCACSSGASPGQHPPWLCASDPLHSTSAMCSASVTCATIEPPALGHLKQGRLMASR